MTDIEKALRAVIPKARSAAAKVGTMHSAWDAIFDAEALLAGKETLLRFESREAGIAALYDTLKRYEGESARSRGEQVEHEIAMEMKLDANRLPTTSQQARLREARRRDQEDRDDAQAEHEALEAQSTGGR